jgi:hypothetical protein
VSLPWLAYLLKRINLELYDVLDQPALILLKDLYVAVINLIYFRTFFFLSPCPLLCISQTDIYQHIALWSKNFPIQNFNLSFSPFLLDSFCFYYNPATYPQSCFTRGHNIGVYSGDSEVNFILCLVGDRREKWNREIENNHCFSLGTKYSPLAMHSAGLWGAFYAATFALPVLTCP